MQNKEIRAFALSELRTADESGKPVIEGHAAVFDSLSEDLGYVFPFKEKIRAGAFANSIRADTVVALWNHDPNYVLGRNTSKTLELSEDERGLFVRIHPPDTQWARDLLVSLKRGDVYQMSFAFTVEKEEWSTEAGQDIRTLSEVKLFDVSPVTYPAYTQTDCGVRSHEAYKAEKRVKADAETKAAEAEKARNKQKLNQLKHKFNLMEDKQ